MSKVLSFIYMLVFTNSLAFADYNLRPSNQVNIIKSNSSKSSKYEVVFNDSRVHHLGDQDFKSRKWARLYGQCYFIRFNNNSSQNKFYLLMSRFGTESAAIFLNGYPLGHLPVQYRGSRKRPNYWTREEWVKIPNSNLIKGRNKIAICASPVPNPDYYGDLDDFQIKNIKLIKEKVVTYNHRAQKPVSKPITQSVKQIKKTKKEVSKQKSGTGFFITNNYLITNHHVIKGCSQINVRRNGYNSIATVVSKDINNDLSVLRANEKNSNSLKLRNSRVKIGEEIITLGYPLGDLLGTNVKLTTGVISALNGLNNDSTKYQFTAPTQHGNSGGPLIDRYGSIIGVIYAGLSNAQNVNLAIKVNTVKQFLEANDIDYENSSNNDKKDISDIADEAKKAIVQVICK